MIDIKNKLKKFVNLTEIKIIKQNNKKIISTCLYIPSNLDYNERSIYYLQGLIKSVETFDQVMNINSKDNWIYRIYYDKMFDDGINFKFNKKQKKTKQMTSKQKRIEKKKRKLQASKKKHSKLNEYKYAYENNSYKNGPIDIQESISKYKESFIKLLKLYHLYLKQIKNNKSNIYKNIELISYDCPSIKIHPKFIGHSSSFGMFLRFIPIIDNNVALFYSVNSSHPITPQLKLMLDKWVSNKSEKAFCFAYKTQNVMRTSKKYIVEPVEKIKMKEKSELNDSDHGLIDIINQIFNLRTLSNFNKSALYLDETNNRIPSNKIKNKISNSIKYNFNYIKKKKKSKRTKKTISWLEELYNFKYLLYNKDGRDLDIAIGGGMCGFKNDFPMLKERYNVFINYINYLISHKIQLEYGLDELIIKIILLPDLYIYSNNIYDVSVVNIRELNPSIECSSSIAQLKQHSTTQSYVFDATGNKLYFNKDVLFNLPFNLFGDGWLIQIDVVDSRAMYKKDDGTDLSSDEILTLKIDEYDVCFNSLFVSFNEPKKLLLLDTNNKLHKLIQTNNIFEMEYINNYDTNNIYKLLKKLFVYYRTNIVQPTINIV